MLQHDLHASAHPSARPRSEDGASAVEYGLLVAGIAALVVATVFLLGGMVNAGFGNTCSEIATHDSAAAGTNPASCG